MQKESKINPDFSTLSQTINILGSELGNVIKQQAGKNNFELVEEIRVNSKKYRSTKNSKFLELIYKRLETLDEIELLTFLYCWGKQLSTERWEIDDLNLANAQKCISNLFPV